LASFAIDGHVGIVEKLFDEMLEKDVMVEKI
jgi:hypothetical protein